MELRLPLPVEHKASRTVMRLRRHVSGERTTVGEVLGHLGDRATGLLLAILAIPCLIPSTGLPIGAAFGAAMAVVACQVLVGREGKLPGFVARIKVKATLLDALLRRAVPLLRRIERHLRPRMPALARLGPIPALLIILHGVLIILPIPLGNTLPGLAVLLFGLACIVKDGGAMLAGYAVSVAAVGFAAVVGGGALWALNSVVGA
ncbi:MAG TPA: exopolysaccharide biosynthesis protein [Azospirillaceae bacterium]|nr:exopolysaccharide biosynthesis protein [Azospirillaceae bacterium]